MDIDDWGKAIDGGIRYKEKYGGSQRWGVYKDYFRGIYPGYTSSLDAGGVLPFNLVYAMKNTLIPNIYFRNPYITVSPRYKPDMEIHGKIVESVDNWLMQELAIKKYMKHAASCAFFTNKGFIKLGYDSQYGFDISKIAKDEGFKDLTFTSFSKKGEHIEYNVNVKPGMPWAISVPAEQIVVPFGVYDFEDCPWIDHMMIRPLADVKADLKYKNTKDLKGTHIESLRKDVKRNLFYADLERDAEFVELHEIRDIRTGKIMVMVKGYDKWLREPEDDPLQIEGLPFVDFGFNDDTEYFWGPSDVQIMEPQQLEMNETRTQAMLHRRVALLKFLVEKGAVSQAERDKMLSEAVGPCVEVEGNPAASVALLQPHIPADLVNWSNHIRSDVKELLGQGRNQSGEVSRSSRTTATEAQIVQMAHDLRMDERKDMMADALVKVMRKINQIVFKYWSAERVVQVVGYDGAKYWVKYNNDAIRGEYNLSVDVESMTPQTKALKRRDLVQLIQALGKHPNANIDYLVRSLLREYPWIDAMKVLPEAQETAGGKAMGVDEYTQHQRGLLNNPAELNKRAQANAGRVA